MFDNIVNRVKDNLAYQASDGVTDALTKGASGVLKKNKKLTKCPKCKEKIDDSTLKFCSKCGFQLVVNCASCNLDYPYGTKFCTQCGAKLKSPPLK